MNNYNENNLAEIEKSLSKTDKHLEKTYRLLETAKNSGAKRTNIHDVVNVTQKSRKKCAQALLQTKQ